MGYVSTVYCITTEALQALAANDVELASMHRGYDPVKSPFYTGIQDIEAAFVEYKTQEAKILDARQNIKLSAELAIEAATAEFMDTCTHEEQEAAKRFADDAAHLLLFPEKVAELTSPEFWETITPETLRKENNYYEFQNQDL